MARRLAISTLLDVEEGILTINRVWKFGSHAGEAWLQTWCEVNHRPLDWAFPPPFTRSSK